MHFWSSLSVPRHWKVLLSQPQILLPSCLRLYPVPASCLIFLCILTLKPALVFLFHDFHSPVLLCKPAPYPFREPPSARSLCRDPQAEAHQQDSSQLQRNLCQALLLVCLCCENMLWLYRRGASSPVCPVFLRCAWWTRSASSSSRSVALGADFIPGDTDEQKQQQLKLN